MDLLDDNHEDKPGSIPVDKQHGYPEHMQVLNTASEPENIELPSSRTMTQSETSLLFDRKISDISDKIMNERELRDFLLDLESHRSYRFSEYLKVAKFWEFFEL